jgi:predicted Zn-dependent peptidase
MFPTGEDAAAIVAPEDVVVGGVALEEIRGLAFPLVHARLANGFDVYVQPRPDATSDTGYLVFRAGSRYETEAESGASHLLEHLLFAGTERWSEDEVRATIAVAGGRYNGLTYREQVVYLAQLPGGHSAELLDWLSQVAFHPTLAAEKLAIARDVVFEERGGRDGRTVRLLEWLGLGRDDSTEILRALFPGSSRARQSTDDDVSLDAITIESLHAFYARHYHAGNAALIYVGPEDSATLVAQAAALFGSLPGGERLTPPADAGPAVPGDGIRSVYQPAVLDRCAVTLAARGPGIADPDRWASDVLLEYLRIELFDDLRQEKGLTYYVDVGNEALSDGGAITIASDTDCANVDKVATAFADAIDRVRAGTVDPARLERARNAVVGRWALSLESGLARASWIAGFLSVEAPFANAAHQDAIPRLTGDDVVRAATTWLSPATRGVWARRPILTVAQAWAAVAVVGAVAALVAVGVRMRRRGR